MAFGDNPFGGNSSGASVGRRGRGNRGGGGGNRNRNRNKNRNGGGGGGGGGGNSPLTDDPFDLGDAGSGNPFDDINMPGNVSENAGGPGSIFTPEGSEASGDPETYNQAAWGLLNQAGISQSPTFGGNQADWLNTQIDDWYSQWTGQGEVTGADQQPWDQWLYGLPGDLSGAPGGGAPGTLPPALTDRKGVPLRKSGTLPPPLQDMIDKGIPPGKGGDVGTPDLDWVRDTWGPAMQQYLTSAWQGATPRQRQYDSRQWRAPMRTVQF